MTLFNIFTIAVALAMDAFAVSIAAGLSLKTVSFRQTFRLAWHFGLFQALMPIIGWSAGYMLRSYIEQYDHWVAFGLLAFVGGRMIREAFHPDRETREKKDPTKGLTMVLLSVAVSIDALAVGLSLAMIKVTIFFPAGVIGIVALIFTVLGLRLGKRIGGFSHLSMYVEILGGIALLLIGLNILREHGVLSFLNL
jgi:putative Mn2+ efflux pump MntP